MNWSLNKMVALVLLFVVSYFFLDRLSRRVVTPVRLQKLRKSTPSRSRVTPQIRIPLILHQTHKSKNVPERMATAIGEWIDKNPEFEHRYYDDADLEAYVRAHGDQRTVRAFDVLLRKFPGKGALRADLFRLLVMQREGGVYADVDTTPKRPLLDIIEADDDYLTGVGRRNDAHQWLLIAVPNHPFISKTLDLAVEAILSDTPESGGIGRHAGYAGPPMLDKGIRTVMKENGLYKDMSPGTHAIDGTATYRVLKGDFLGGQVRFKYEGYDEDLKELGLKHWTVG